MSLLRSKIRPPALPATAIERPRLVDRILDGDHALVLLQAAAGFGKSVLAAQVRAEEPERTAWLHLEPEDAEPRRFCRYLAGALAAVAPALERTELGASTEADSFEADAWMEDLLLFLQEFPRGRLRLVLDNYESVGEDPHIRRLVGRLVRHGFPPLQVTITSRTPPRLSLRKREAEGTALVLTERDLAFRLDEFREAARAQGRELGDRDLERLWSRSEGWCVYLGLSPEQGTGSRDGDYLDEEILGRLPPDLLEFLRVACLLDVITPEGAGPLGFEAKSVRGHLDALAVHGVPHLILDGDAARLHPVVRERMIDEYRRRPRAAGRDPGMALVESYRNEGRQEGAVRTLLELGEHERLLDLVIEDWETLTTRDLLPSVKRWLHAGAGGLEQDPRYAVARVGHLRFSGDNRGTVAFLEEQRASGVLPAAVDDPRIWAAEHWARTLIGVGEPQEMLADQWQRLEPHAEPAVRESAVFTLTIAAIYELRFGAGVVMMDTVLEGREGVGRAYALNGKAALLTEMGRVDLSLACYREGLALARGNSPSVTALLLIGRANAEKDAGRFHDALGSVEESVLASLTEGSVRPVIRPHVTRIRGESLWHLGRRREGLALLHRAFEEFETNNLFERLATGALIDHWSYVSGIPSAVVAESDFTGALRRSDARVRYLTHRGRRLADEGEFDDALRVLREARELAAETPSWQATTWFTEAWAEDRSGNSPARDRALGEGLAILDRIGRPIYSMADAAFSGWIAARAVAMGSGSPAVAALVGGEAVVDLTYGFLRVLEHTDDAEIRRLLKAAIAWNVRGLEDAFADGDAPADELATYRRVMTETPLPPLRARLFGGFEAIVEGREAVFARKAARRVFEVLLVEHPAAVHEEQLMELLWPDADPGKAKRSLQTAVNELRRALDPWHRPRGRSYVGYDDEHYALVLPEGSFVDLHAFRDGIRAAREGGTDHERAGRLRAVLDLHRGELLPDERYAEFATEARERARASFLEVALELARLLGASDRREAIAVLERGLGVDPYWAEGLALLLDCLAGEGRTLAAIRRYRDYEKRLADDLGLSPDAPLRKRFEALVRG